MIELDLRSEPSSTVAAGPRDWVRGSRWVAIAVTLGLLAGLAGSVPMMRRLVRTAALPVPAGADLLLSDQRLYTVSAQQRGTPGPEVAAYTHTGQRLWRADSYFTGDVYVQEARDLLLITGVARSGQPETLAVDAVTGEQRWATPSKVDVLPGGRSGLISDSSFEGDDPQAVAYDASGQAQASAPVTTTLRVIDLAENRQLWSARYAGNARTGVLGSEIVVGSPAGVEVRDVRGGAVLRSVALTGGFALEALSVTPDLIIAQQAGRRGGLTYAYRTATMEPAWIIRLPGNAAVEGCGDLPCYGDYQGGQVLDPATGEVRWPLSGNPPIRHGGLLLTGSPTGDDLRVLAAADGTTAELPGWRLIFPSSILDDRDAAPALVTREADGLVRLAVLPRDGGPPEELGSLSDAVLDCQSTVTMLACRTTAAEVRIWQLEGVGRA